MFTGTDFQEYLKEIRAQVCSRCVERPVGGPPCFPLGKWCVIETNLSSLVEAIHEQSSPFMGPYLDRVHHYICTTCPLHGQEGCPCPGEYLMTLVVQAVGTVDERRCRRAETLAQH
jgi:hypothetical protein